MVGTHLNTVLQAVELSPLVSIVPTQHPAICARIPECQKLAHLPAGICDLAASLANYARLESAC